MKSAYRISTRSLVICCYLGEFLGAVVVPCATLPVAQAGTIQRSADERELIKSSRQAILETGFSESYFDQHFKISRVFNKPSDTRILWKLSVNGYQVEVNDALGYYTGAQGEKVYTHSIKNTLGATRDITKTISRRKAEALLWSCLGGFTNPAIVLMRLAPGEKASLYLTAHSITRRPKVPFERDRKAGSDKSAKSDSQVDQPEREDTEKRPPLYVGYIQLESGRCSKGQAIATP